MRAILVERAQRGEEAAFDALVDLDGDRCYAIAYRVLRDADRAQDAVQSAFLQVWRELPRLREPARYEVWLHRIVINACYMEARRHRQWRLHVRALPTEGPLSVDPTLSVDDRDAIDRAFARLSPEQRAVFVLHHHAGLPLADVAEIVGVPLGTVKSRLHYASQVLQGAIAADSTIAEPEVRTA